MSEFDGLWKHKNNQRALVVPLKTECGSPSGGGIKNGHTRYPLTYGGMQTKNKIKEVKRAMTEG